MNFPIDTCENGECSFAIRGEYDKRVYAKNLGLGGGQTCTITSVQKDNLVLEIYSYDKSN